MTERWKRELVEAIKEISLTLPELTAELRRFNDRQEIETQRIDGSDFDSKDSTQSADS